MMQDNVISGYRLSPQQKRIWELQGDDAAPYSARMALRIKGNLRKENLSAALTGVINRHEILRTTFHRLPEMTIPVQVINDCSNHCIEERESPGLNSQDEIDSRFQAIGERSFDFEHGPLLFAELAHLSPDEHVLFISLPAVCADEAALKNLTHELGRCYAATLSGETLADEVVQYADIAEWQNELLEGEGTQAGRDYWRKHELDDLWLLRLPFEIDATAGRGFKPEAVSLTIEASLKSKADAMAAKYSQSSELFLLACWQVLLWRLVGREQIIVGKCYENRNYEGLKEVIGVLATFLPVACRLKETDTFNDVLARIAESANESYEWQEFFSWSLFEKRQGRTDFFPFCFGFQDESGNFSAADISLSVYRSSACIDRFKINLSCVERGDALDLNFYYDSNLFRHEDMVHLSRQFRTLFESALNHSAAIGELPVMSESERLKMLVEFNNTKVDYDVNNCVHHLIEAQAQRTPNQIAVVYEYQKMTYGELDSRSNRLARYLQKHGAGPEAVVAVYIEKSLDMVVALLGVIKAGSAFLPIAPELPEDRLAFMLADAKARLILTQKQLVGSLPAVMAKVVCVDTDWGEVEQESDSAISVAVAPQNSIYVIYTSGSTGRPKGVVIEHRQLTNYVNAIIERLNLPAQAGFALVSSFAMDLGYTAIFPSLCSGGTLYLVSNDRASSPEDLTDYFTQFPIDCLKIVPSHLAALELSSGKSPLPRNKLVLGGEASRWDLIDKLKQTAGDCQIINHYGPTEATVGAVTYPVDQGLAYRTSATVPIGYPLANVKVYLLDTRLEPVPLWVAGELYISGEGLARGYHHRADLTAEKFVPDPFSRKAGERMYRTGDLARWRADGAIEFLGRLDHQVKLRGFRIELGEIESVLAAQGSVKEAAVIVRQDEPSSLHQQLVAYLVVQGATTAPSSGELRAYLKERLPDYMVPGAFVVLEEMPLTPNGKLDRKALPPPDAPTLRPDSFIAPRNQAERTLAAIWQQLLGLTQISINDNFFELGGDSILSIQIVARANAAGLKLTPRQMFQHQTIAELAEVAGKSATAEARGQQGAVTGEVELTPIQARFFERGLKNVNHYNQSVMLEVVGEWNEGALRAAVEQLMEQHDALRMRFEEDKDGWRQYNEAAVESVPVIKIDLSGIDEERQRQELEAAANSVQKSLDIRAGKMMRVAVYELGRGGKRVQIVVHHLVVDGVSWRILLEDLQNWYEQADRGERLEKREKTSAYKEWAAGLKEYANSEKVKEERRYWEEEGKKEVKRLEVEKEGGNEARNARSVVVRMEAEETKELLQEVVKVYGAKIDEVLIGGAVKAIGEWVGGERVRIEVEGHGREEVVEGVDVTRTVGWFTSIYPVVIEVKEGEEEQVGEVKRQMRRVPEKGIGYGVLNYEKGGVEEREKAEVIYNYLGQFDRVLKEGGRLRGAKEYGGATYGGEERREHLLEINCMVVGGQLQVEWGYSEGLHRRETIEKLADRFKEVLKNLIARSRTGTVKSFIPSDFPVVNLDERMLEQLSNEVEFEQ